MIAAVGLDSFDTSFAGCTTHLASLITHKAVEEGLSLVDYPWLIRLNPAVPWKTRGNGAVALLFSIESRRDLEKLSELLHRAAKLYSANPSSKEAYVLLLLEEATTLRDYFTVRPRCLERLYLRAVHEALPLRLAQECIEEAGNRAIAAYGVDSRGILGALAALGAVLDDFTFELITYRKIDRWTFERRIDELSVIEYDLRTRPLTFMNYDYLEKRVLIHPHGYDPVLYGVRGEEPGILLKALDIIDAGEEYSHWILFRTNQATNAHLRRKRVSETRPYDNPVLVGYVSSVQRIPGGHVITELCDDTGCIDVAFYRETGVLKRIALRLPRGSQIEVGGQVKPHRGGITLNAEYLRVYEPGLTADKGCPTEELRYCGYYTPPLSSFHHLMLPPGRHPVGKSVTPPSTPIMSDDVYL
ncbi:nucleic acid binding domain protein [Pyrodictium delaneyi]|uniref:tRNA(Ile2) 2-agmatinylcytidine synthetase TiaS n=1 Tax=Pyrodictium delaneyi TaxID=1273541 RepID=A0A0P0N1Y8_9CREN|nr:DUF1743 domain-containing protein [Pyrodictium delaneyi]ALL00599.1 nucleic acid binding domain protein [Pyrodictium delaneyi]